MMIIGLLAAVVGAALGTAWPSFREVYGGRGRRRLSDVTNAHGVMRLRP